jgi:TolA-binding protein
VTRSRLILDTPNHPGDLGPAPADHARHREMLPWTEMSSSAHPDRAWQIVRWVAAGTGIAASIGLLVLGGFTLYYAKEASSQNPAAQVQSTQAEVQKEITQTQQLIMQAQKDLAAAQQTTSQNEAKANQVLSETQKTLKQTNALLTDIEQTQKQLGKEVTKLENSSTGSTTTGSTVTGP